LRNIIRRAGGVTSTGDWQIRGASTWARALGVHRQAQGDVDRVHLLEHVAVAIDVHHHLEQAGGRAARQGGGLGLLGEARGQDVDRELVGRGAQRAGQDRVQVLGGVEVRGASLGPCLDGLGRCGQERLLMLDQGLELFIRQPAGRPAGGVGLAGLGQANLEGVRGDDVGLDEARGPGG
jgi:hypothetical protein